MAKTTKHVADAAFDGAQNDARKRAGEGRKTGWKKVELDVPILKLAPGDWIEGKHVETRTGRTAKHGNREFALHVFAVTDRADDVETEAGESVALAGAKLAGAKFAPGREYRVECVGVRDTGKGVPMTDYLVFQAPE